MRNHIVRPHLETEDSKTGLGGYADMVAGLSESAGYDTDITEIEFGLRDGWCSLIVNDVIRAFLRTLRMGRGDICHFVFEGSAAYILFCRSKKVVTFHHYVYKSENNSRKWYAVWRLSAMMAVKRADAIIAISEQTREEIIREMGADPSKITVISHLANDSLYVDPDCPKEDWIGCMGTLTERKNYPALVRVFTEMCGEPGMDGYELHICGKGPMQEQIEELAESLGVGDRLFFHSNLDNKGLNDFYNRCRLTLNTSMHEGLGMLTLESQMCGTPVLYFEDADIPGNTTAAAVPCKDESDMARKALELLSSEERYGDTVKTGLEYTVGYRKKYRNQTLEVYRQVSLR